jgi:hypothetical protein
MIVFTFAGLLGTILTAAFCWQAGALVGVFAVTLWAEAYLFRSGIALCGENA